MILPRVLLFLLASISVLQAEPGIPRQSISLNGKWLFQRDKAPPDLWKQVTVPSSFQSHEGIEFHGVGWYKRHVDAIHLPPGMRLLVHFQAAATEAEVWWDGQRVGSHLGGWTPFRFDITELVRSRKEQTPHELRVRLDEKAGHNTQGFLPIIAPHFGGIWQEVQLLLIPETYIDDLNTLAVGDPAKNQFQLELPIKGSVQHPPKTLGVRYRLRGTAEWHTGSVTAHNSNEVIYAQIPIQNPSRWSFGEPNIYELELALPGTGADNIVTRAAFRAIEARGHQFVLNNSPVQIRGLLNWGYSPPAVEPNPGEKVWRDELEFARKSGFNLMKFCLWIPPRRYLELADEMGMLTWLEYPTWHPDFSERHLDDLNREFKEFFAYDRNHPSIILRSLTCETGPSADIRVIKSLYDSAHQMIPGALVEDDSSWIGWNRISDFYDDHPYGNNHTWVQTLQGLKNHILTNGVKPLVLGESIAADTWLDRDALLKHFGTERPWYAPGVLDDTTRFLQRTSAQTGASALERLTPDSLRYGMLMRKYQIEAFRREIPYGGYVISVIRDIPSATMGLLDYLGKAKWSENDWAWQKDTLCLLKTASDRRSFFSGEALGGQILLSHFGKKAITEGSLTITLGTEIPAPGIDRAQIGPLKVDQEPFTLKPIAELNWIAPQISKPTRILIQTSLTSSFGGFTNEWPIWIVPRRLGSLPSSIRVHESLDTDLAGELFPVSAPFQPGESNALAVASRFDADLASFVEAGGRLLLIPDGKRHSLPLSQHWFLRGAPFISSRQSCLLPRDMLLDLQHFDLAGEVVPNVPQLDSITPLLMLWDTHDQKTNVHTHGIIFETRIGRGRILVTTAKHTGAENSAGRWLLGVLLDRLASSQQEPEHLPQSVWDYAKARLGADQTNLVERLWKFNPDPRDEGLTLGWQLPKPEIDTSWSDIHVGAWWESQSYPALDGWAWYRLWVNIPAGWQGRDLFLSFEGVDDIYELFVNGELIGKGGDLATRKDALQERRSWNITPALKSGNRALIAVRVHDWYGAGGIFRPVTLGTLPFEPLLDFLK